MLWMSPLRQEVLANRPGIPLAALSRPGGKMKGHPGNGETAASPDALLVDLNSPTGRKTHRLSRTGRGEQQVPRTHRPLRHVPEGKGRQRLRTPARPA